MPKGIPVDEKEVEIQRLKFRISRLEGRIDEIEKVLESPHCAFQKAGSCVKGLNDAAEVLSEQRP